MSYDITLDELDAIKSPLCPEEIPYLCTSKTESFGLCRKTPDDCRIRSIRYSDVENITSKNAKNTSANQYGYHQNNITDFCGTFKEEYSVQYEQNQNLPQTFKVLTWNIWGMNKHKESGDKVLLLSELMMLRMEQIVREIIRTDPDVIIIQEMSYEALGLIRGFMRRYNLKTYKGFGQNFSTYSPNKIETEIGRDLETYVFAKYTPRRIIQYNLSGNLGYSTPITCLEYDDVCIIGCYLQAGSKHSPGQSGVWFHYSRCRSEQVRAISKIIDENYKDKTTVLCGDFNMDLDGDRKEWPETVAIKDMNMIDSWRSAHPDKNTDPGYTEDTYINHMRWNQKFMEKRYRYDGILFKNGAKRLNVVDSVLIGTKSYPLEDDMYSEFMRVLSNRTSSEKPRSKTYHPSDHFGVMTTFTK